MVQDDDDADGVQDGRQLPRAQPRGQGQLHLLVRAHQGARRQQGPPPVRRRPGPSPSIPAACCHVSDQLSTTRLVCRDYWIVSESLLPAAGGAAASGAPTLHDVFHLDQCKAEGMEFCSDHCPIGVTVALP